MFLQADRGLVQLPNPPSSSNGGGSTDQCQYVKGKQTALKLFTQSIPTCFPTHSFSKKHDRSKHLGRSQLNPTTLVGYLCY